MSGFPANLKSTVDFGAVVPIPIAWLRIVPDEASTLMGPIVGVGHSISVHIKLVLTPIEPSSSTINPKLEDEEEALKTYGLDTLVVPIPIEFVTFNVLISALKNVDTPVLAYTFPVRSPWTFASRMLVNVGLTPKVTFPYKVVSPFTSRLLPKYALSVTVEVPTTWNLFVGFVTPSPRFPS